MQLKVRSCVAQVSQFAPSEDKYRDDRDAKDLQATEDEIHQTQPKQSTGYMEEFHYATGFNQE